MQEHPAAPKLRSKRLARLPVNSSHHQAIGIAGDGLRIVARCPQDDVVEAVEGTAPDHFVLGIQWHPERSTGISAASRAIFDRFIKEAASLEAAHRLGVGRLGHDALSGPHPPANISISN